MGELTIYRAAVAEIKNAILQSRYRATSNVNVEQLTLNYNVGRYVSGNTRSGKWGTGAIETISNQLQTELPGLRGYSTTTIKYMRTFYEKWSEVIEPNRPLAMDDLEMGKFVIASSLPETHLPDKDFTAFLRIGFTHHREILKHCSTWEERWYYIKRCASEFWSVYVLKYHIQSDDYAKYGTMSSNFKLTIPNENQASRAVQSFKSEYLLDFINIEEETDDELIDEPELHSEILNNIRKFIMAFGKGFCFVASKYRVIVEDDEYFVDLVFYNRSLDCLVAIELKRGEFKPAYLGQLNFYLTALDEYEKMPDENPSVGIILCRKAKKTIVEFAVRDFNKPMGVATYKLGKDIPEPYQSLIPVIDGVQQILSGIDDAEEEKE
jgi:predicted nuclease of restriction endonuclease-like (RecB) superfamily